MLHQRPTEILKNKGAQLVQTANTHTYTDTDGESIQRGDWTGLDWWAASER